VLVKVLNAGKGHPDHRQEIEGEALATW